MSMKIQILSKCVKSLLVLSKTKTLGDILTVQLIIHNFIVPSVIVPLVKELGNVMMLNMSLELGSPNGIPISMVLSTL